MKISSVKLLYNAAAHFAACEKYPDGGLVEAIRKPDASSFDAVLWAWTESAKQAELYRRFMGEDPKRILTEEEWRMLIKPGQMAQLTNRVMEAIIDGMGAESDKEQEIDEVLMELEKKTGRR